MALPFAPAWRGGADLVVLDLMLPGEDGLSLLKWLRTDGGPPVIIVSARGEEVDQGGRPGSRRGRLSGQALTTRTAGPCTRDIAARRQRRE